MKCEILKQLDKPSLLSLMPFAPQGGWAEEKWRLVRQKLRRLSHIGCHRLEDAGGQGELRLLVALKTHDQEANTVLEWVALQHHCRPLWELT